MAKLQSSESSTHLPPFVAGPATIHSRYKIRTVVRFWDAISMYNFVLYKIRCAFKTSIGVFFIYGLVVSLGVLAAFEDEGR